MILSSLIHQEYRAETGCWKRKVTCLSFNDFFSTTSNLHYLKQEKKEKTETKNLVIPLGYPGCFIFYFMRKTKTTTTKNITFKVCTFTEGIRRFRFLSCSFHKVSLDMLVTCIPMHQYRMQPAHEWFRREKGLSLPCIRSSSLSQCLNFGKSAYGNSSCVCSKSFEVEVKNAHEFSQFDYYIQYWETAQCNLQTMKF